MILALAAGQGLEPQLTAPEAVVLPLDEPAILSYYTINLNFASGEKYARLTE